LDGPGWSAAPPGWRDPFALAFAIVHILVGWLGLSFIVGGLWIVVAVLTRRAARGGMLSAAVMIVLGGALLWGAFRLP
jgi:hypothetical protein